MVGNTGLEQESRESPAGAGRGFEDRRDASVTKLIQDTPRFFEGAKQGLCVLEQASVVLDHHLARRFSVLNYFGLKENSVSNVLADLLKPDSVHGQRDLFLTTFLNYLREDKETREGMQKRIFQNGSTWSNPFVHREALTDQIETREKRIDIKVSLNVGGRRVAIAIENKPWPSSKDGSNQIRDYADQLHKEYCGRYLLLYLTPDRRPPAPESLPPERREALESEGRFARVSLIKWTNGWLQDAERQVKPEYVRHFVADFRQALLQKCMQAESSPARSPYWNRFAEGGFR